MVTVARMNGDVGGTRAGRALGAEADDGEMVITRTL